MVIRFEELQQQSRCPSCNDETLNAENVCDECGQCADCFAAERRGYPHATVCERHSEAAYDRQLSDFYGSSPPVTDREKYVAAWGKR